MGMAMKPEVFDGCGFDDPIRMKARGIVDRALFDEIEHLGYADISATLVCFLECRIAEGLRMESAGAGNDREMVLR